MSNSALLKLAIEASVLAGKEILSVYNGPHEVEFKDDKSPLTIADRKSHAAIVSKLEAAGLPVLSEEGRSIPYDERKSWSRFWMVDPLDGTKEFIKRNGEFTVNIALIENGQPVLGVIYVPVEDKLYYGSAEEGSYIVEHVMSHNDLETALTAAILLPSNTSKRNYTVVASRSHLSPETEVFIDSLRATHGELSFLSRGSSLKICLVAEGAADVYPRLAPTMEWDTAAGQAIAMFAGCTVTISGTQNKVVYNKPDLLNPHFIVSRN